ncbi:hypothetical protein BHE74_00014443 [Ensete ventricosum]|nr:hypothetical protein BHE74_00014443 [Ensete ventricosum]
MTASPTSSRSVTETVNGSHKFVIQGYSLAKGMGVGKHIASDTFTIGGYQWAIYFYPDGKNIEDNSTYVSVFIALASDGTDVRALFELTLVDQSGKGKHKIHSHFDRSLESGPYTLKYRGSMEISVNSVASTLALADRYHAMELKDSCLKFAAENLAAVMRSSGFEHLKDNSPSLQSELLTTIAGCEEEYKKSRSDWGQLSDGEDSSGRRIRPRTDTDTNY